jgi:hypothetical protein
MRANHAAPELKALVDRQTEGFNTNAPEEVRVENFHAIQEYQEQHRREEA